MGRVLAWQGWGRILSANSCSSWQVKFRVGRQLLKGVLGSWKLPKRNDLPYMSSKGFKKVGALGMALTHIMTIAKRVAKAL